MKTCLIWPWKSEGPLKVKEYGLQVELFLDQTPQQASMKLSERLSSPFLEIPSRLRNLLASRMHRGSNALDKGAHWQEKGLRNSELDNSTFSN